MKDKLIYLIPIVIGILVVVGVSLLPDDNGISHFQRITFSEPVIQGELPREIYSLPFTRLLNDTNQTFCFPCGGSDSMLVHFSFPGISSIEGLSKSKDYKIRVSPRNNANDSIVDAYYGGNPWNQDNDWGNKITYGQHSSLIKECGIGWSKRLILKNNWVHNYVTLESSMNITYPVLNTDHRPGFADFYNKNIDLVRKVKLFLITPEEFKYWQWLHRWELFKYSDRKEGNMWPLFYFILVAGFSSIMYGLFKFFK